jgi:hypothetical protein
MAGCGQCVSESIHACVMLCTFKDVRLTPRDMVDIVYFSSSPNVAVGWLALLRIREVTCSNVGPEICYADCGSWFSSVHPGKCRNSRLTLNLATAVFLHIFYCSVFINHPIIRAVENVVKKNTNK